MLITYQGLLTINAVRNTENNYVLCNKETNKHTRTYIYKQTTTFYIMWSYSDAFMSWYKRLVVAL